MRNAVPILAALLVLAGCGIERRPDTPVVTNVWVRLPARPEGPGAAYFIVRGGARDTRLESVSSPNAARIEFHGPGMRPIGAQPVPAGGELAFSPGDRHAMVFWNGRPPRVNERMPLTFHFSSERSVTVRAVVIDPGMPIPTFVDRLPAPKECVSGVRQEGNSFVSSNCGPSGS